MNKRIFLTATALPVALITSLVSSTASAGIRGGTVTFAPPGTAVPATSALALALLAGLLALMAFRAGRLGRSPLLVGTLLIGAPFRRVH